VSARVRIASLLAIAILLGMPALSLSRESRGLHDQAYTSPTWGYHVRWYGDEWAVGEESSEAGTDALWLSDRAGNVVGFSGVTAYGGDAATCLEQRIAELEALPGAADVEIVSDEAGTLQLQQNSWWSWAIMLVRLPTADQEQLVDHVVYLDCRTLVPGSAVLMRTLAGPVATFEASMDRFAILQATLPRSAWTLNPEIGHLSLGDTSAPLNAPPLFEQICGGYPRTGQVALDPAGMERLVLSLVDGTPQFSRGDSGTEAIRVVMIENTGDAPLPIAPSDFVFVSTAFGDEVRYDVAPAIVTWEESGESGARTLAPGELAVAHVIWPAAVPFPDEGVNLVFRNAALSEEMGLGSIGIAGGCGGGSLPELRLGR
jgi:hypothetical protein